MYWRGSTAAEAGPGAMLVGCGKSLSYRKQPGPIWSIAARTLAVSNQKQPYIWRLKYSLGSRSYSGCSWGTPQLSHCQSRCSRANGSQPTPLSTDTNLRSGKRWHTPPVIRLAITETLATPNCTPNPA